MDTSPIARKKGKENRQDDTAKTKRFLYHTILFYSNSVFTFQQTMDHGSYSMDDGIMSGADSVIGQTRTVSCRMENEASVILSSHMVDVPKRMRISPESSECHTIDDSPMDMNALPPAAIPSADDVLVQVSCDLSPKKEKRIRIILKSSYFYSTFHSSFMDR